MDLCYAEILVGGEDFKSRKSNSLREMVADQKSWRLLTPATIKSGIDEWNHHIDRKPHEANLLIIHPSRSGSFLSVSIST